MRIGTWNVDARWDQRHQRLVADQACDVWLMTEVPDTVVLPNYSGQATNGRMSRGQRRAAVYARDLETEDEPDPATAARMGEVTL